MRQQTRPSLVRVAFTFFLLALAFASIGWLIAAPKSAPRTEQMPAGEGRASVDYTPSATAADVGLPFYPGAKITDSFVYEGRAVTGGNRAVYYSSAILSSTDTPAKVATYYTGKLAGHPKAEVLEGDLGRRHVLAIAQGDEVKTITITAASSGSRIELIRASRPIPPPRPLRPKGRERVT